MRSPTLKLFLLLIGIFSFTLILTFVNQSPIDEYISAIKMEGVEVNQAKDPLYREIEELAKQIDQQPVDAKSDPIWKAIPGYNGVKVNVKKSYEIAKQLGKVQLDMLMYEELEPKVSLDDLPPAPIYRGNSQKPMVSFMVNVAWGTEYVQQMLDLFDQYQVRATFFLDGKWLENNAKLAQKIIEHGHEIGNHAYSHPDLSKMSADRIKEEMLKTNQLIEKLGVKSYLFAPPSGAYDNRVVKIAHQYNMKTILWTLDTVDWRRPPAETIKHRIIPHLENGALILMHPTEPSVAALPALIEGAFNKDLMVGTVSQVINPQRTMSIISLD